MIPLIPVLISALPSLAALFKNAPAQKAAEIAVQVAQEVFGTSDPAEVKARLDATPADGETIRKRLETELGALQASLQDMQDARAATAQLAQMQSAIAWGSPVVSVVVLVGFATLSYVAIYAPPEQREVLLFLLGTWSGLAAGVVQHWTGSSISSRAKDAVIANFSKGRGND
jgi:hypothetical protein